MTLNMKKFLSKLNSFHIILLGCILGCVLVINSNHVNEKKAQIKLSKEQDALFNRIVSKRKLESNSKTDEICSRGSDSLINYYETGDLSKIDLEDGAIKCEDCGQEHMQALIDLIESLVGGGDDDDDDGSSGSDPATRLRNLLEEEDKENIKKYGSRILPMVVFLGIGILCIIGYIVCWISCCCDCCCCCCCIKKECKIPCFIFTYVFYALVVVVCFYGLSQTKNIFTGLANTECSFLQFFDQVLKGEHKEDRPKWIGINKIDKLMNDLEANLREMRDEDLNSQLSDLMDNIEYEKDKFMSKLQTLHKKFYENDGVTPLAKYCLDYQSSSYHYEDETGNKNLNSKYVMDLIPALGKYNDQTHEFEPGLISGWNQEIAPIDGAARPILEEAQRSFNSMLGGQLDDILGALDTGKSQLGEIKEPFDNLYGDISDILYDASKIMDKDGKLIVNLVFGVLAAMNVCLAALLLLICLFSGQSCVDCCFCRCIFKFATHVLWNILAIMMILSFIVGSLLSLTGRVGEDMMSVVSYIVSEENFRSPNKVLLGKLGEGQDALEECILGNGDLSSVFGLNDVTSDFDTINTKKREIREYISIFRNITSNYYAYNYIKDQLIKRTEFEEDTIFININDNLPTFKMSQIITNLNNAIGDSKDEKWDQHTGDKNFICPAGTDPTGSPSGNQLHPWYCEPNDRDWVSSSSNDVKNYANIATDIVELLKNVNKTDDVDDFHIIMDKTKIAYKKYLDTYLNVLGFFDDVITEVVHDIEEGIGSDSNNTFSFLNGKFIRTDIKVLLKYLKYSLGKDIYTVGLCLVIVGFSLIFSVSSTILLIIIINKALEENKKLAPQTDIPNFPEVNDGNVVKFQY